MRVIRESKRVEFTGEGGESLAVVYDNRGEPYREGVTFDFYDSNPQQGIGIFLESQEVRELRDLLNRLYPA